MLCGWLVLFKEITAVCCRNRKIPINTLRTNVRLNAVTTVLPEAGEMHATSEIQVFPERS
jgi:hypothetical protein